MAPHLPLSIFLLNGLTQSAVLTTLALASLNSVYKSRLSLLSQNGLREQ